jgi:hypothetical protein
MANTIFTCRCQIGIACLLFLFPFCTHAQELPDAPKPTITSEARLTGDTRPINRIFWTGVAALGASSAADMTSTARTIDRGGVEYNPLFGVHPSHARLAGVSAAMFAGSAASFYMTERSRHRWIRWGGRAALAFVIEQHVRLSFANPKHGPPAFRF